MIEEQIVPSRLENKLTLLVQLVIKKICQFNYEGNTRFQEVYENKIANKGATRIHIVAHFNWVVTLDI